MLDCTGEAITRLPGKRRARSCSPCGHEETVKILIIEDEAKTAAYLQKGLSEEGFVADTAPTGDEGVRLAHVSPYDLIILDIMLPGRDGWAIMESLRKEGSLTPVVFLTARDTVQDRVRGLELGADDYLVKPFAFSELLARVRSVLRRGPSRQLGAVKLAGVEVGLAGPRVSRGGKRGGLTAQG